MTLGVFLGGTKLLFDPVSSKPDFPALEREILDFWKRIGSFETLVKNNRDKDTFSFIDGPITANNPMGAHHAWGRTYKDIFQRYQAMHGKDQRYQNGFDCQGLWVEVEVEKDLGLDSKREIERFGLDRFSAQCRARVDKFSGVQTEQSIRLGQWMHWDDSYYTMSDTNVEYIWHFLKKCAENGWLYKGHTSMPWCTRCGTSLSQHELIDSYRDVTHPSIYLRLPIKDRPGEYLLVWTTTPWTLPANVACAVHPELDYVKVRRGDRTYYLSKGTIDVLAGDYEILATMKGQELIGWRYEGPFDHLPAVGGIEHRIVGWDEVNELEGTGIVHIAPGCGAEDYELSKVEELPAIVPIDDDGNFVAGFGELTGIHAHDAPDPVATDLYQRDFLYKRESISHRYPVCWRCQTELVFKLVDEWFISAGEIRPRMIEASRTVRWVPDYAGKRMEDWLNNMGDWCISRKRFWGLPLPFYDCDCGELTIVGSRDELASLATEDLTNVPELHRPWIDTIKIRCPGCGGEASRITAVGDCWLDAGIVPFSTLRYLTDREYWEKWFPADLVLEMREQIRLWFYSLLFMSVTLEDRAPYETVFVFEKLQDEQGRAMHKSLGNAIWFDDAAEEMGADVMRWIYTSQNPSLNLNFGYGLANETRRRILTLWNVYSFWITYANIDQFDPTEHDLPLPQRSELDRWIIAKLNRLVESVGQSIGDYQPAAATRAIEGFLEDLSNWYVRRSRRRFWKSEADSDKLAAYLTLYETLVALAKLMAPITPFLSESIYQNLVRKVDRKAPDSVHHNGYPTVAAEAIDERLLVEMGIVQQVVNLGRSARNKAGIKVRQPVGELVVAARNEAEAEIMQRLANQCLEELNAKALRVTDDAGELTSYAIRPKTPLLGPKYGRDLRRITALLEAADPKVIGNMVQDGKQIPLDGFTLLPDEVDVQKVDRLGLAVASDHGLTIAIDTDLTEELLNEGIARELAHRIQTMRKTAGFDIADRIELRYSGGPAMEKVFEDFNDYIGRETLATKMMRGSAGAGFHSEPLNLGDAEVEISIRRIMP